MVGRAPNRRIVSKRYKRRYHYHHRCCNGERDAYGNLQIWKRPCISVSEALAEPLVKPQSAVDMGSQVGIARTGLLAVRGAIVGAFYWSKQVFFTYDALNPFAIDPVGIWCAALIERRSSSPS